jgi:hypothetical protein
MVASWALRVGGFGLAVAVPRLIFFGSAGGFAVHGAGGETEATIAVSSGQTYWIVRVTERPA